MVKSIIKKVKPKHGFAHLFHLSLIAVIPPLVFIFIRIDFISVAVVIVLLSKWRMFAVKPRHWLAHIRTNAVDIIVSLSLLTFMITSGPSMTMQLAWLLIFEIWVLYVKQGTSILLVSAQALVAQCLGTIALFLAYETAPAVVYVTLAGVIAYFSARHFFASYEESHGIQYSWLWTFFASSLVWILSHWLLFYGPVAQVAVMLSVVGYGLAGIYYLHEHDKLTQLVKRQIIFVVFSVVFVMIAFANWGDGIIK